MILIPALLLLSLCSLLVGTVAIQFNVQREIVRNFQGYSRIGHNAQQGLSNSLTNQASQTVGMMTSKLDNNQVTAIL